MAPPTLGEFRAEASAWLASAGLPEAPSHDKADQPWGEGSDDVSIFHNLSDYEERRILDGITAWQRRKYDAGYGAITWPTEYGGRELLPAYEDVFVAEEARYLTPGHHETAAVTLRLIAPTVRMFGTTQQKAELIRPMLRGDLLVCQLFSEPDAGSDLANLGTRAVRKGDEWVISGQKVWTSGAQFADWGELLARTDPGAPKHNGITAFLVPMQAEGVEIRPLRQMSGGTSFNEVFLTEVRIPDAYRLGEVGQGWKVGLTTLGFERDASSANTRVGASWQQVLALAQWTGASQDPLLRQQLADVYIARRLGEIANSRDEDARRNGDPLGAVGSIRMMQWVGRLLGISAFAQAALGPRLAVDTGEWGTYAWAQHVLGAPGYRIAGGSDEIQRNIIAERLLGLPAEPRVDRGKPWREARV